ncbi:hypothetical protein [Pedobacter sp. SYP-B3415]|uniref:hypothetical protein n=1 Tax=Pedobacter sp. SYP-B3415 TaxID=2496641 RepID=UPI00101BABAF|nr:hypothetical protein [Pedobacter sp. SYP-B3415]
MSKTIFFAITAITCLLSACAQESRKPMQSVNRRSVPVDVAGTASSDNPTAALLPISEDEFLRAGRSYKNQLAKDSLRFTVRNGVLAVPIHQDTIRFTDNAGVPYDENEKQHSYYGFLKGLRKHVILLNEYESQSVLLLDQRNAKIDTISGLPLVSPNGKFIFASYQNGYETYEHMPPPTEDIEVWALKGSDKMKLIFSAPYKWILQDAHWDTNNSVCIRAGKENTSEQVFWRLTLQR